MYALPVCLVCYNVALQCVAQQACFVLQQACYVLLTVGITAYRHTHGQCLQDLRAAAVFDEQAGPQDHAENAAGQRSV
jgi:hypothetical protein